MTTLKRLLEYVQVSKKLCAVRGHSTDGETNRYQMGMAFAYQDVENILIRKIAQLKEADNGSERRQDGT